MTPPYIVRGSFFGIPVEATVDAAGMLSTEPALIDLYEEQAAVGGSAYVNPLLFVPDSSATDPWSVAITFASLLEPSTVVIDGITDEVEPPPEGYLV